ncbi:MAG TPA: 2-oxo-4-hydroxy-4-carboxy-5-ureidoimidazoline decarboxylase [Candidatus Acidoferrum sp.]|nr:2-oxo-4-hydroxy-4-carboxy-5-ureidoimidazoline decarboxylase [Candidatus Acidoferrum sp.]
MNRIVARWNLLPADEAAKEILSCCGSRAWAQRMASSRPFEDVATLLTTSDRIWRELCVADWSEAFQSHPRIGERGKPAGATAQSAAWSAQEQRGVADAGDAVAIALAEGNQEYERRFGHIFMVCATGKSAREILQILDRRLRNDDETELHAAAEELRKITELRLKKWLSI